jgi:hypothetical protein
MSSRNHLKPFVLEIISLGCPEVFMVKFRQAYGRDNSERQQYSAYPARAHLLHHQHQDAANLLGWSCFLGTISFVQQIRARSCSSPAGWLIAQAFSIILLKWRPPYRVIDRSSDSHEKFLLTKIMMI